MTWNIDDPQGNEAGKVAHRVIPYAMGEKGVDIGCGPVKIFPKAVGVDNCKDTELFNIPMNPDIDSDVMDMPFKDESFDWAFSSHVLEHLEEPEKALIEWMRIVKVGGYLILYLPHKDLYPRIGEEGANPDHKHDFDNQQIVNMMLSAGGWVQLENEIRSIGREYSLFQVYQKLSDFPKKIPIPPVKVDGKPIKRACVVRYGGFGDVLQAAMVLPALQKQGYEINFMTTPKGQKILEGNPFIDRFIIQGDGQIPQDQLPGYWQAWSKEFDRWVNLSETVEGTLLSVPGRANHLWPDKVRRERCNVNYAEFTAQVAQVPFEKTAKVFYPNDEEKLAARATIDPDAKTVMWALSGSAQHKFYAGMDIVIARLLLNTRANIILVGDDACRILEAGWEKEDRVICMSGELDMRDTLTLAQYVDVVVGPETGVLNSVAHDASVGKVCLLSHSSHENLTKHWVRTAALEPEVACYPCHRLHYTMEFCHEDKETGSAICQQSISPDTVFEMICKAANMPSQAIQVAS